MQTEQEKRSKREQLLRKYREQYIEDRKTGKYRERKMYFLIKAMEELKISASALAQKAGISYQALYYKLVVDDIFLAKANELMSAMGLQFKIELKSETKINETAGDTTINMEHSITVINFNLPDIIERGRESRISRLLHRRMEKGGLTAFIVEFMNRRRIGFAEMCKACKFDYNSTMYCLDKDDIKLSMIYQIARTYKAQVSWDIKQESAENTIKAIPLNMIAGRNARQQ